MKRPYDEGRAPAIVANNAIRDSRHPAIDHSVKVVLWAIASRLNAQGVAWPTMQLLAGDAGMHRVTVIEIVQWLRDVGVVIVDHRAETKSFTMRLDSERLGNLPSDIRRTKGKRRASADRLSGTTGRSSPTTIDRLPGTTDEVVPDYRSEPVHRSSPATSPVVPGYQPGSPRLPMSVVPGYPKDQDEDPNEGSSEGPIHALTREGDGPSTSRTPESISTTKPIPLPPVAVVAPQPTFTLTPPEPVAAKTAPKRAKTTTEPQKPTTAPTMPEDATALPANASPAPKAPKGRKPPEERSDARYLRAFDAGIAKGAGIPAFATPPHGLTKQTLIAIAKTHAVKDGEPITGEDLLAWFEARAAAFRKYAADVPDLKFNGGWSPKGLLWWLNGGCLGEPKPPRPPRPIPPAAIDAPDWEMPESAKGKTLEQLIAEVGKPRPLHGPMPEDELQFLREAQARGQAKYKAMREEMAKREAAAEVVS